MKTSKFGDSGQSITVQALFSQSNSSHEGPCSVSKASSWAKEPKENSSFWRKKSTQTQRIIMEIKYNILMEMHYRL